ncbi:MAG TPA: histidine kinase [Bacteroidia bacterium]|nr:histidine kinase [Bacteroidia bacterium]
MSAATPTEGFSFTRYYWWFQAGGWSLYVAINASLYYLQDTLTTPIIYWLLIAWLACTGLTELLRGTILRFHWLKLKSIQVVPRLLVAVMLLSVLMASLSSLYEIMIAVNPGEVFELSRWVQNVISYSLAFVIWSALYFLINTLENFRKAEIENLRWEALKNETELMRLKSQLNPHFMFNAMNVIRALVDENPIRSKEAITQLSSLLRNTLQVGKFKVIPLQQELEVVRDYLSLESARMEERLRITWDIHPESESFEVPPLMLQTLVENCIKHGISKIPEGGDVIIKTSRNEMGLNIVLENSGHYDSSIKPESGFGLRNSLERLDLLYSGKASLTLKNSDRKTVITELFIPKMNIT